MAIMVTIKVITATMTPNSNDNKNNYNYNNYNMKEKIKKEYFKRTRKLLEIKLYSRNLIKWMNAWAVPLVRYSEPWNYS